MNSPRIDFDLPEINVADQRILSAQLCRTIDDAGIDGVQINFETLSQGEDMLTRVVLYIPYQDGLSSLVGLAFKLGRILDPIIKDTDTMAGFKHANALD